MEQTLNGRRQQDEHVKKVLLWRETLTTMSDERFFDMIRTYLGPVQTPYNKPNLIERLSSVFRKDQSKQRIISYLSDFDFKMLTVIHLICDANQEKIIEFFSGDYTLSEIYAELLSLNERLLIFSYFDQEKGHKVIAINPLLDEALKPYLSLSRLIPSAICAERNFESETLLSPLFIAAFIAYIRTYPDMLKSGFSLKKKDTDRLESIFPAKKELFELLLTAFSNLGIFRIDGKTVTIDLPHLQKFALLPEIWQYAYIATSGAVHLGRTGTRFYSQLLLDLLASVPKAGFTKHSLCAAAFILENSCKYQESRGGGSYFSSLASRRSFTTQDGSQAETDQSSESTEKTPFEAKFKGGKVASLIVESAILLKLFEVQGKTEDGEEIYVPSSLFVDGSSAVSGPKKGLLNINAGTNITIMPGFTLSELIPLSSFLEVSKHSTVTEFYVTRKSAGNAFDLDYTPEKIFELLESYTAYEIPQNLKMNVEEWFKTYSSAMLYKGYVLKVEEKTARVLEKNPNISKYIQLKLAEGIYLLNLPLEQDLSEFMEASCLEFMGSIRTAKSKVEVPSYPVLGEAEGISFEDDSVNEETLASSFAEGKAFKAELLSKLKEKGFNKQIEEMLKVRIEKGIVLSEEQLKADSVRLEILEADGMNYAGKIRLVENAISAGDSIEIMMPADFDGLVLKFYLGKPIAIIKQETDCIVKMSMEEDGEIRLFSISRANKIRLVKTSYFG